MSETFWRYFVRIAAISSISELFDRPTDASEAGWFGLTCWVIAFWISQERQWWDEDYGR